MPFLLYDVSDGPAGRTYHLVGEVKIGGNSGPLPRLQAARNPNGVCPFGWHAALADLLAAVPGSRPGQEIVLDLKPGDESDVSLCRLRDVWGFSYATWTPLALRLECLFGDYDAENPTCFREAPPQSRPRRSALGMFLYVQGGVSGGTWNWGKAGRVNGALLWPDAFAYLARELGAALAAGGSPGGPRPVN